MPWKPAVVLEETLIQDFGILHAPRPDRADHHRSDCWESRFLNEEVKLIEKIAIT